MKVLLDTNVVLDLLLDRAPYAEPAAQIFSMIEKSEMEAALCATTVTTIDYLLSRSLPHSSVHKALMRLLELFEIAPVNRSVLEEALACGMKDYEDAVLAFSANLVGASAVVTRNTRDFRDSPVKAVDPLEFISSLN